MKEWIEFSRPFIRISEINIKDVQSAVPNIKDVQPPLPVNFISSKANDKIVVKENKIFCMRTKTKREKRKYSKYKAKHSGIKSYVKFELSIRNEEV